MAERISKEKVKNVIRGSLEQFAATLRSVDPDDADYSTAVKKIMKWYKKKRDKDHPFTILIIGETGSGKSTLINNILVKKLATVSKGVEPQTSEIDEYKGHVRGVKVTVYDTPGLQDSRDEDDKLDRQTLENIKSLIDRDGISVVIFCFKITETRICRQTVEDFKKYHLIGIPWNKAVVALTFADRLAREDRPIEWHVQKWRDSIRNDILVKEVGLTPETTDRIAFHPTTEDRDKKLPNNKNWFVPLWFTVLEVLEPGPMMDFLMMHNGDETQERTHAEHSAGQDVLTNIIQQNRRNRRFEMWFKNLILRAG